jgi:hypothetical protein
MDELKTAAEVGAFPGGTISFADIRSNLAPNNSTGPQTPVSIGDVPVRGVAGSPTGTVSISSLRNKTVLFSATMTFGTNTVIYGYSTQPSVGSFQTSPYYKAPVNIETGASVPLIGLYFQSAGQTSVRFTNNITPLNVGNVITVAVGQSIGTLTVTGAASGNYN